MRTVGLIFEETMAEKDASSPEKPSSSVDEKEKSLEKMTLEELRACAAAHNIDVTGAAKKADFVLAIKTALDDSGSEDSPHMDNAPENGAAPEE